MNDLNDLLAKNKIWADQIEKETPGFFSNLAKQQAPNYLWIGCADSRVPANQLVDLLPGEMFVHRNIANVVMLDDLNCLSVIQFSIEVLKVKHIIVCGHYGCGGVKAAYANKPMGLIDGWLKSIKDVYQEHKYEIEACPEHEDKLKLLCEKNVQAQVKHVCQTDFVKKSWQQGNELSVHGWIYNIEDGRLKDLFMSRNAYLNKRLSE
jgi:carbonic anhydrase